MADFVIVGGGVVGCGVAWELSRLGLDVLLLEAGEVAAGASGGLGKRGVRANGRDRRELPLIRRAHERWETFHEAIGGPTGFVRCGGLELIERQVDLDAARATVWLQNTNSIATELLDQAQTRAREPHVSERIMAAVYCPDDGVADHTLTTRSLAGAARYSGAEIRERTAVSGLERRGDQVKAVITHQDERIPVGKALLLLCNSQVSTLLDEQLNLTLPVWNWLPQIVLTEPVAPMPVRHNIGHAHRLVALKGLPSSQVMISGGWRGRWNETSGRGETIPEQVGGNVAEAVAVYPSLRDVTVSAATADRLETFSLDNIPIIDRLTGTANLYFATGWSGHGWAIAPAVMELLSQWVRSGEQPGPLRPFRLDRFTL